MNLGTENVSLEAWFKTAKKTGQGFIYIKLRVPHAISRGAAGGEISSKTPIADGKWRNVVQYEVTKPRSLSIWMANWILRIRTMLWGSTDNESDLTIRGHHNDRWWNGELDELCLCRKTLIAKEAKQAWTGTLTKTLLLVDRVTKLTTIWSN